MASATEVLVLDASVAVAWHLRDEDHGDLARRLLAAHIVGAVGLIAPQHIRYEVPSAITTAALRRSRLSQTEAGLMVAEFLGLDIPAVADDALVIAAQSLAFTYGCALYDGLYLALAERLNLRLITADRKLYNLIRAHPLALWIQDWR